MATRQAAAMISVSTSWRVSTARIRPNSNAVRSAWKPSPAADDDHADGDEHGEEHGHRRVGLDAALPARARRAASTDAERRGQRAEQQRLAEGEGDGDAGEHRVLDDLGEERQPAQQDVHADDAAEHAEQHHLDHGAAHERVAQRLDQQVVTRPRRRRQRASSVAPSTSSAERAVRRLEVLGGERLDDRGEGHLVAVEQAGVVAGEVGDGRGRGCSSPRRRRRRAGGRGRAAARRW